MQLAAQTLKEFPGILHLLEGIDQIFQIFEKAGILLVRFLPFLVGPVGRNAFLGNPVHLFGTDLDLDKVEIGAEVSLYFWKVADDDQGNELMAYAFRPVSK